MKIHFYSDNYYSIKIKITSLDVTSRNDINSECKYGWYDCELIIF